MFDLKLSLVLQKNSTAEIQQAAMQLSQQIQVSDPQVMPVPVSRILLRTTQQPQVQSAIPKNTLFSLTIFFTDLVSSTTRYDPTTDHFTSTNTEHGISAFERQPTANRQSDNHPTQLQKQSSSDSDNLSGENAANVTDRSHGADHSAKRQSKHQRHHNNAS
jgi:hypothetical protein